MLKGARVSLAVGLVMLLQLAASAQGPTFRSLTELVNLNVTVVGIDDEEPVQGLTEDQFQVFEDGVPQQLQFFASGKVPLDVVVLLDTSASMAGSMPLVQSAAIRLIRALRAEDRAAVMGISGGLRILQTVTGDKAALTRAIAGAKAGGRTPLYASIYTALNELTKIRAEYDEPRRQAIVVLSDGHDTASAFGFDELLDSVRRDAVPIYAIAPRPTQTLKALREAAFGETTHEQDYELRRLASETGARAFFPVTLQQLAGVYDAIANELAHQYSLGYQSSNPAHDGAFRQIALRVKAPGVRWRTRTGYIAEGDVAVGGLNLR